MTQMDISPATTGSDDGTDTKHPPAINLPPLTLALILGLIVMHVLPYVLPGRWLDVMYFHSFLIPFHFWRDLPEPETWFMLVGNALWHADLLHLAMNIAMLAAFGTATERRFGWLHLLGVLFAATVIGNSLHLLAEPLSKQPVIGASGGISGLVAFMLVFLAKDGHLARRGLVAFILVWLGFNVFTGLFGFMGHDIAWLVHMGGFAAGMIYAFTLHSLRFNR